MGEIDINMGQLILLDMYDYPDHVAHLTCLLITGDKQSTKSAKQRGGVKSINVKAASKKNIATGTSQKDTATRQATEGSDEEGDVEAQDSAMEEDEQVIEETQFENPRRVEAEKATHAKNAPTKKSVKALEASIKKDEGDAVDVSPRERRLHKKLDLVKAERCTCYCLRHR